MRDGTIVAFDSGEEPDRVDLREASLVGTSLARAKMTRADLREADLSDADLAQADLRLADLRGADLHAARNLTQKQLDVACSDATTRLPAG